MQNLTLVKSREVAAAIGVAVVERTELPWPARAAALKIVDKTSLDLATEERAGCKDLIEEAHKRHDPTCASAYTTWRLKLAERKTDVDPPEAAIAIFDRNILAWNTAEKLRVAREKRDAEERARLAQIVEREAVIEHAEAIGASPVEVKSLVEAPLPAPVVYERPAPQIKPQGAIVKEAWKGEITDIWALVQFAVQNNRRELISLLAPDPVAVRNLARALISAGGAIPGLRIWDDGAVASAPKKTYGLGDAGQVFQGDRKV